MLAGYDRCLASVLLQLEGYRALGGYLRPGVFVEKMLISGRLEFPHLGRSARGLIIYHAVELVAVYPADEVGLSAEPQVHVVKPYLDQKDLRDGNREPLSEALDVPLVLRIDRWGPEEFGYRVAGLVNPCARRREACRSSSLILGKMEKNSRILVTEGPCGVPGHPCRRGLYRKGPGRCPLFGRSLSSQRPFRASLLALPISRSLILMSRSQMTLASSLTFPSRSEVVESQVTATDRLPSPGRSSRTPPRRYRG